MNRRPKEAVWTGDEEASTRPQTATSVKLCYRHIVVLQILLKRLPVRLKRSSKSPKPGDPIKGSLFLRWKQPASGCRLPAWLSSLSKTRGAVFGATAPTTKRLSAERKVSSYLPSTGFLDKFQSGHKAGAKSVCRGIVWLWTTGPDSAGGLGAGAWPWWYMNSLLEVEGIGGWGGRG